MRANESIPPLNLSTNYITPLTPCHNEDKCSLLPAYAFQKIRHREAQNIVGDGICDDSCIEFSENPIDDSADCDAIGQTS